MLKKCCVSGCNSNKWRTHPVDKRPALFNFPKSSDLLNEWMKRIPDTERGPSSKDLICSLHFQYSDIKHYESTGHSGQPRDCLVENAVPVYFKNNNPDEELIINSANYMNETGDHNYNMPSPYSTVGDRELPELQRDFCSDVLLDHCYNLPVQTVEENRLMFEGRNKAYTIDDLHEDALDLILPERWSFIQIPEDNITRFLLYGENMCVLRSIEFNGTCFPIVTVKKKQLRHKKVINKQEIQELLEYVDGYVCEGEDDVLKVNS